VVAGFGIYYRGYLTADGALTVGCLSPATRAKMLQALQIEDPMEGVTGRIAPVDAIRAVEDLLRTKTTDEWMAIFDRFGVPASPVWFVEELLDNPQVIENGYAVHLDHDLTGPQEMAAPPLKMSDSPPAAQGAAPPLGRDTRKWLKSAGWTDERIDEAIAAGSVAEGP